MGKYKSLRSSKPPLVRAARAGDDLAVKAMLEMARRGFIKKFDVNATTKDGTTALMMAAMHGHAEVVRALLSFDGDGLLRGKNAGEFTRRAIGIAVHNHQDDIVDLICEHLVRNLPEHYDGSIWEDQSQGFRSALMRMKAYFASSDRKYHEIIRIFPDTYRT
ncbi:ankyrin repeat domain-containing protein [Noviherbaspirillum sp. 17J57-3]|uniref:Ankyrin repeat domain-containing protein n=2 Tax=Noviherbaspirillum galbum TaxID=2709383 RepID=A0A6B3SMC6_9BURK|nr:ankyrin repeat domain-containing protein [Noviherbaspirillum galbum]